MIKIKFWQKNTNKISIKSWMKWLLRKQQSKSLMMTTQQLFSKAWVTDQSMKTSPTEHNTSYSPMFLTMDHWMAKYWQDKGATKENSPNKYQRVLMLFWRVTSKKKRFSNRVCLPKITMSQEWARSFYKPQKLTSKDTWKRSLHNLQWLLALTLQKDLSFKVKT